MPLMKNLPQSCLGNFYLFPSHLLLSCHLFSTEEKLQVVSEAYENPYTKYTGEYTQEEHTERPPRPHLPVPKYVTDPLLWCKTQIRD